MNWKRASMLVSLMVCVVPLFAYAQGSRNCATCGLTIDHGTYLYWCSETNSSPGGCGCQVATDPPSCSTCGYCTWNAANGALCYDETGDLCSRPACENAALKPDLKLDQEPTPPGRQTSQKELLESSPWLTDADFQEKIDAVSRDLGSLVKGYQTIFQHDWRKLPQKDRRTIEARMVLGNISYKLAVSKWGSDWRIELSPDPEDPESHPAGAGVPNTLQITGRKWQVIHHIHGVDKTDDVIASGTY